MKRHATFLTVLMSMLRKPFNAAVIAGLLATASFAYAPDLMASGSKSQDAAIAQLKGNPAPSAQPGAPSGENPYIYIKLDKASSDKGALSVATHLLQNETDEVTKYGAKNIVISARYLPSTQYPKGSLIVAKFESTGTCGIAGCDTFVFLRTDEKTNKWVTAFGDSSNAVWVYTKETTPYRIVIKQLAEERPIILKMVGNTLKPDM